MIIAEDKTSVHLHLNVTAGTILSDALAQSQIYDIHPETRSCTAGIFSKIMPLNTVLREGDRIELYRSLALDPKEKRRQLARSRK